MTPPITHPEQRLVQAGWRLPAALPPSAHYVPWRRAGALLHVSGHGPREADGSYRRGRLQSAADVAMGYAAAQLTALNMLATVKQAVGDLARVESVLKVLGMVNAAPDFEHHPKVIDGFSDVLLQAFGDAGRHARSAVGMGSLPHGMAVEVEAIFLLREGA